MVSVYKRKESPYYQAKITVGGRPRRISTQETVKSRAKEYAERFEKEENDRLAGADSISLVEAAGLFLATAKLRPRTKDVYQGSLKNIYQTLGDFPLATLTPDLVQSYINQRLRYYREESARRKVEVERKNKEIDERLASGDLKGWVRRPVYREIKGHTQIGHDLRFLSSLFKAAGQWDASLKGRGNPVLEVETRKKFKPGMREGFLTEKQVQALFDACKQDYQRLFLRMCIDTGMRKSEILGLRWDEIDFDAGWIVIGNLDASRTKNGKPKRIPLTKRALVTLKDTYKAQKGSSKFVFPSKKRGEEDAPITTVKTFWSRLCKDAGLKDVTVHDLRHTFASWAVQKGIDISVVQPLLGHTQISTTKRYAKHTERSLQGAIEVFEENTLGHSKVHTTL